MKLKKYEAPTEKDAMEKIKYELGEDALIINIRKIQPRGIKSLFKKAFVEITAAYTEKMEFEKAKEEILESAKVISQAKSIEEKNENLAQKTKNDFDEKNIIKLDFENNKNINTKLDFGKDKIVNIKSEFENNKNINTRSDFENNKNINTKSDFENNKIVNKKSDENMPTSIKIIEQQGEIKKLQQRLETTEELLEKAVQQLKIAAKNNSSSSRKFKNSIVDLFYKSLVSQGVCEEIALEILKDVGNLEESEKIDINFIVKLVYNKIINIIGEAEIINTNNIQKGSPKLITFIGPTGVGKTTTIAKLSSHFILNDNFEVGLLTADTYRIAAIDQLRTYAEILNIDVGVIYNNLDLIDNIVIMSKKNDLILIDTAGRSHKNKNTVEDLSELLAHVRESENYLVLSLTTKYEDLIEIISVYDKAFEFKLLFTKLDETKFIGSILNICYTTNKKVSYLTAGQSVPDDIEVMNPGKIAKLLLGIGGE